MTAFNLQISASDTVGQDQPQVVLDKPDVLSKVPLPENQSGPAVEVQTTSPVLTGPIRNVGQSLQPLAYAAEDEINGPSRRVESDQLPIDSVALKADNSRGVTRDIKGNPANTTMDQQTKAAKYSAYGRY